MTEIAQRVNRGGGCYMMAQMILAGDLKSLVNYDALGPDAALSIPTPDHFLLLLYVLAARQAGDGARFPIEGVDGGSISMLSVQIG